MLPQRDFLSTNYGRHPGIRKPKVSPLNGMKYSSAGTLNLPIEIWREIFTITFSDVIAPARLEDEFQRPEPTDTCTHSSSSLLSDYETLQSPALFKLRRALVLVCKSWYFMAIPYLRSHIRIRAGHWNEVTDGLYPAFKDDPSFASSVLRLSIEPFGSDLDSQSNFHWPVDVRDAIRYMASAMSELRVVVCPYYLAHGLSGILYPDVAIIYKEPRNDVLVHHHLLYGDHYWHHCRILSITWRGKSWIPPNDNSSPSFPNLVELRLEVTSPFGIQRVADEWKFPKLRILSISSQMASRLVNLIRRLSSSLEHLEILCPFDPNQRYEPPLPMELPRIAMPNLKSVCLYLTTALHGLDPVLPWMAQVQAPHLRRICFHVRSWTALPSSVHVIRHKIRQVRRSYPTVKKLRLCISEPTGDPVSGPIAGGRNLTPILAAEDIIYLRQAGVSIEVFGDSMTNAHLNRTPIMTS